MNIIEKKITDIKPYDKNPRKNDEAVQYVAESIRQFGIEILYIELDAETQMQILKAQELQKMTNV